MATRKNVGQILIDAAMDIDPDYSPDKFNDLGEAVQILCNQITSGESGGGSNTGVTGAARILYIDK